MALTDLTRISTSGIATGSTIDSPILRKDVSLRGSQVGVTSALFDSSEDELKFNDNVKLKFGDGGDLNLYHTGDHSYIQDTAAGNLILDTNGFAIRLTYNDSDTMLRAIRNESVELYWDNAKKFETAETGAIVTGILTATSFSGPIVGNTHNTSGLSTFYDLRVSNNLTVEGTTTTLDTNLIGVDRVEIDANSNTDTAIVGIQSGTADIVNLFDGGTNVVTIDDEGKVGINSTSPTAKLDIVEATSIAAVKIKSGTNTNQNASLTFLNDNGGGLMHLGVFGSGASTYGTNEANDGFISAMQQLSINSQNASGEIRFGIGVPPTTKLCIKSNGKVGIGSDSPAVKLDVAGSFNVSDVVNIGGASPTASEDGQLNVFTTTSGGKVQFVHSAGFGGVRLAGTAGASGASLVFSNNYNSGTFSDHWTIQHNGQNDSLRLLSGGTGGTQRLCIKSNGLVGIGTENPGELLVAYKTSNDAQIKVRTTAAGAYFEADSGSSGYHGIKLSSIGTQKWFLGSYDSNNFQIKDGSAASGAERFTIEDSTGNIGIGTNNPTNKFEVYGTDATVTLLNYGQSSGGLAAWTSGKLAFVSGHQNDNLVFGYSNSTLSVDSFVERMRIDNGTGEVKISDGGFLTIDTDASGDYGVSEALRIDDGGGTGDRALQIFEYHHNGARYHRIQFNTNTTSDGSAHTYTQGNYGGSSSIEFDNSGHLSFFTNAEVSTGSQDNITPSERLTIRSDGKIGIGIANPDELLHIFSQNSHSKIVLESDTNSANNGIFWVDEGDNTQSEFYYSHPDNKQFLKVNGNGFEIYSKQQSNVIAKIGHGLAYNDVVVPNGKLGVGTDNAGTTLDVFGSLQVKNKTAGLQNFYISESAFKFSQSVSNWNNMDYTSSPVLAWDYKTGPGDLFYIGSGGNTPIADQMALIVSDAHGFKVGKSGYDGSDFDVDSSNEFFRITTSGNIGINESNPTSKLVVEGGVVINNANLTVDKHIIDGTDDWAGASHAIHHKRSFTHNTWTNIFKFYRTTTSADNNAVGTYGGNLHISYIYDRSNTVHATGYDVFPFVVRARSLNNLSGNFASQLVNLEEIIGATVEVRFTNATTNQIDVQVKFYRSDAEDDNIENLVHAWIDGGGVATNSSRFLYPSVLT